MTREQKINALRRVINDIQYRSPGTRNAFLAFDEVVNNFENGKFAEAAESLLKVGGSAIYKKECQLVANDLLVLAKMK